MTNDKTGPDLGDPILGLADAPDPPLSSYGPEDWAAFVFFWVLAFVVFLQFFSTLVVARFFATRFALSSVVTPLFLRVSVCAVASRRRPVACSGRPWLG